MTPQDVLDFWFGPEGNPDFGTPREAWFRKDAAFDSAIAQRFGATIDAALAGGLAEWEAERRPLMALVIVLDQFTRNTGRGDPRSFAGDARALALADRAVTGGLDRAMPPVHRRFLYLPFEHSESLAVQKRSVELFAELSRETGDRPLVDWAWKHYDIIARFGRFPHRNAVLGRISTPEEAAFLREPGSSF